MSDKMINFIATTILGVVAGFLTFIVAEKSIPLALGFIAYYLTIHTK